MIRNENGVLIDERNNRASIEYFGSEEAARKALESCSDCSDCSDCYFCYRCSDCIEHVQMAHMRNNPLSRRSTTLFAAQHEKFS